MKALTVVVSHGDASAAQSIADSLRAHFRRVSLAPGRELRQTIASNRAQVAIVDLEAIPLDSVRELCGEFPDTAVICVHRVPDDEMWTAAVNAGAVDCCHSSDIRSMLHALRATPARRVFFAAA